MTIGVILALVGVIVLVNAVFVAAEFALLAAPRTAIEHRASTGDRLARQVLALIESAPSVDRYIATAQLGITVASLGLGMFGEHELARWLEPRLHLPAWLAFIGAHALSATAAVAALTFVHIVIGEMVPKSLALQRAETTVRLLFWPMRTALLVAYPLVTLLNMLGRATLSLFGVKRQENTHEQVHTADELKLIVEESERGGALRAEAGHLLKELFDFGDLTAGQAMVPRVRIVGLPLGASPSDIRQFVETHRHTRYLVYDRDLDHVVGMLHTKDFLKKLVSGESITAADVRSTPVVPVTMPLDDVLTMMQRAHAHMAVVIDEYGGTAGLLSIEDLIEEVVGEIDDGSPEPPALVALEDGSADVSGTLRLDELGRHFNVDLGHDEVESVSGLVLAQLGEPPDVGAVVEYGRLRLRVTAMAGRGVKTAHATLAPEDTEA